MAGCTWRGAESLHPAEGLPHVCTARHATHHLHLTMHDACRRGGGGAELSRPYFLPENTVGRNRAGFEVSAALAANARHGRVTANPGQGLAESAHRNTAAPCAAPLRLAIARYCKTRLALSVHTPVALPSPPFALRLKTARPVWPAKSMLPDEITPKISKPSTAKIYGSKGCRRQRSATKPLHIRSGAQKCTAAPH